MDNPEDTITEFFSEWSSNVSGQFGPHIVAALLILVIGYFVVRVVASWFERWLINSKVDNTLSIFLARLVRFGLFGVLIVMSLTTLGVPMTSVIAILGAASLAIGLALQDSLANIASGVLIIFLRPYVVDNFVEISGQKGTVTEVGFFHTHIRTPDNKLLLIPNRDVMNGNIINYSDFDYIRLDMVFGIGYGDDLRKAKEILEDVLTSDPRVMTDPPPIVAVSELGDSSVNLVAQPFVELSNMVRLRYDVTEQVKLRFDKEGITIPYPQQDVYIHTMSREEEG